MRELKHSVLGKKGRFYFLQIRRDVINFSMVWGGKDEKGKVVICLL